MHKNLDFHQILKDHTQQAHSNAESQPFIEELMSGKLNQSAYLAYLTSLLPIYQKMEEIFKSRPNSILLNYFDHRALDRTEKLQKDIETLSIKNGYVDREFSSTEKYTTRINRDISDVALLAHHYIRYLGDLSGGQAISRLVARHYAISAEALNFYDFTSIGDSVFYKKRYRDLLNFVFQEESERQEFLLEVTELYKLNAMIFAELGTIDKFDS